MAKKKLADIPVPQDPELEQVRNQLAEMRGKYQEERKLTRTLDSGVGVLLQYLQVIKGFSAAVIPGNRQQLSKPQEQYYVRVTEHVQRLVDEATEHMETKSHISYVKYPKKLEIFQDGDMETIFEPFVDGNCRIPTFLIVVQELEDQYADRISEYESSQQKTIKGSPGKAKRVNEGPVAGSDNKRPKLDPRASQGHVPKSDTIHPKLAASVSRTPQTQVPTATQARTSTVSQTHIPKPKPIRTQSTVSASRNTQSQTVNVATTPQDPMDPLIPSNAIYDDPSIPYAWVCTRADKHSDGLNAFVPGDYTTCNKRECRKEKLRKARVLDWGLPPQNRQVQSKTKKNPAHVADASKTSKTPQIPTVKEPVKNNLNNGDFQLILKNDYLQGPDAKGYVMSRYEQNNKKAMEDRAAKTKATKMANAQRKREELTATMINNNSTSPESQSSSQEDSEDSEDPDQAMFEKFLPENRALTHDSTLRFPHRSMMMVMMMTDGSEPNA